MRWGTLLALALPALSRAENRAATAVSVYTDDDATDVVTGVARVASDVWSGGTLEAHYLIDMITSASVDVITQATPAFSENRHSVGAGVAQKYEDYTGRLTYGYSRENDYWGHGIGLGVDAALLQDNTTLSADYALELGTIGRADDEVFREPLTTHSLDVVATQVLSRRLVGQLGATLQMQSGYTAKAYRFARVGEVYEGVCLQCPPETHPNRRVRAALTGGAKLHLGGERAIEATYRFYADTWELLAHTAEMRLHLGFGEALGARLRYRYHTQGAASFYEDVYDQPRRYMTADRELSPLDAHLVGAKLFGRVPDLGFFEQVQLNVKVDLFQYSYDAFSRLPRRRGLVIESGLEVEY